MLHAIFIRHQQHLYIKFKYSTLLISRLLNDSFFNLSQENPPLFVWNKTPGNKEWSFAVLSEHGYRSRSPSTDGTSGGSVCTPWGTALRMRIQRRSAAVAGIVAPLSGGFIPSNANTSHSFASFMNVYQVKITYLSEKKKKKIFKLRQYLIITQVKQVQILYIYSRHIHIFFLNNTID